MTDKMREDFESWVIKQNVCVKYGAKLIQCRDGSYKDYRINDRWNAWKASRAALCVELPEVRVLDGGRIAEIGYEMAIDDFELVLDAAGVRHK